MNSPRIFARVSGGGSVFAIHQETACVQEAEQMSAKLLAGGSTLPSHQKWFALQSCRIESLQGLGDDLQATIKRDAAASQRSSFLRLLAFGLPLVFLCVGSATITPFTVTSSASQRLPPLGERSFTLTRVPGTSGATGSSASRA